MSESGFIAGKLLILDDDEAVGSLISSFSEGAGFATRTVTDAADFLAHSAAWQPTHIILDLIMPQTDGVEILNELARRGCGARIILMSGADRRVLDAARRNSVEQGLAVIGVLPKPFEPDTMLSLLDPRRQGRLTDHQAQQGMLARAARAPAAQTTYAEFNDAIEQRQLFLVYQPKIRCSDYGLAGAEALVRWQHPTRGLIAPCDFVPFAESSGLIDAMTELVVDLALTCQANFHDAGDRHIAINLSAKSLADRSLPDRLVGRCQHYQVDPQNVVLELTETAAMADPSATVSQATRLRLKGFQLSIDDFGVGYSSFEQLARLPFSELKVDASFVRDVSRSSESRNIVAAMLALGHSLGMTTTAEGVSDCDTLAFLRDAGCEYAQGYFIGRPMLEQALRFWQVPYQEKECARN